MPRSSKQFNPTDVFLSVFSLRAKHFYAEFMKPPGVLESIVGNQDVEFARTGEDAKTEGMIFCVIHQDDPPSTMPR